MIPHILVFIYIDSIRIAQITQKNIRGKKKKGRRLKFCLQLTGILNLYNINSILEGK